MTDVQIPKNYIPLLCVKETEHAIVLIKDFFQLALSTELNLTRVTAPLFVPTGKGLNDDLNGIEHAVSFTVPDIGGIQLEIVHSLAKWKRVKIADLQLERGFGIYTDMNAIRADEELDNIHSLYVDQWDWEMVIDDADRSVAFLKEVVQKIYRCLKRTEFYLYDRYSELKPLLPEHITFIHAEDLLLQYPDMTAKEREHAVAKKYGAVFIIGIGYPLADGKIHDGRAPDYDDWIADTSAETNKVTHGLNGDLLVWNALLESSLELSSMGIRVSPQSLMEQLELRNCTERSKLYFHSRLLSGDLTSSIGGGIGQSRLCMYFLRKAHIGETQVSTWSQASIADCTKNGIPLL